MIWSEDKKRKIAQECDLVYMECERMLTADIPCVVQLSRFKYHKYSSIRDMIWKCVRKAILCTGSGSLDDFRVKQRHKITWEIHYKMMEDI